MGSDVVLPKGLNIIDLDPWAESCIADDKCRTSGLVDRFDLLREYLNRFHMWENAVMRAHGIVRGRHVRFQPYAVRLLLHWPKISSPMNGPFGLKFFRDQIVEVWRYKVDACSIRSIGGVRVEVCVTELSVTR